MKNIFQQMSVLFRGLKLLFLFLVSASAISFVIQSCQREQYETSINSIAKVEFTNALKEYKAEIGKIFVKKNNNMLSNQFNIMVKDISAVMQPPSDNITTYIEFPDGVSQETLVSYENTSSLEDLAMLIDNHNGILQYEPTDSNSEYQVDLPLSQIEANLTPLVQESKKYLYTKGFTDQDIQQMIVEENAEEIDLIPLVMAITEAESGRLAINNISGFFPVSMAYAVNWNQVGHCAVHALGVDILFSLGASSATVWSMAVIKSAFKTVAKRMLGPIGVAIAVVDFGFCMNGVEI